MTSSGRSRRQRTAAVLSEPINTGYVPISLTNATGAPLSIGDVVAVDYATGTAFDGTAAEAGGIILTWVIAVADIPAGAVGSFGVLGVMWALVDAQGSGNSDLTAGTWLEKHLTTGSRVLRTTGLSLATNSQPAPPNAIAYLLQDVVAGTTATALVYFPGGPRTDWPTATWFDFFEDFLGSTNGAETAGTAVLESWQHAWARRSGDTSNFTPGIPTPVGGVVPLFQDATAAPALLYTSIVAASGFWKPFDPQNVLMEVRYAQRGTGGGPRRVGLWGTTPTTAAPADGVLLAHQPGSSNTMRVNVHVGGVLKTLNTGILQADAEWHAWRVQHDAARGVFLVWCDGLYIGRVASAFPPVLLGAGFASGDVDAEGYLDYIRIRSRR